MTATLPAIHVHRPRVSGALPLSPVRQRALDAMRARGVVGVVVGDSIVYAQGVRESDDLARDVMRVLDEAGS